SPLPLTPLARNTPVETGTMTRTVPPCGRSSEAAHTIYWRRVMVGSGGGGRGARHLEPGRASRGGTGFRLRVVRAAHLPGIRVGNRASYPEPPDPSISEEPPTCSSIR